jgi:hypothetical protein
MACTLFDTSEDHPESTGVYTVETTVTRDPYFD